MLAARPKTLVAGILPVVVGTALSVSLGVRFSASYMLLALTCGVLIQVATNYFNDAIDFTKGADTTQRLGPRRAAREGWLSADALQRGAFACLIAVFLLALPLFAAFGLKLFLLALLCLVLAYAYTGGPIPLAYRGLGELFVITFFGFVAVGGSFFLQAKSLSPFVFVAGLQVGLLSTVLLAINNLRDVEEDRANSKWTLAALFGKKFGRWEIMWLSCLPYALGFFWVRNGNSSACYLPLMVLPVTTLLCKKIFQTEASQAYNAYLGVGAIQLVLFSILLSVGFIWIG